MPIQTLAEFFARRQNPPQAQGSMFDLFRDKLQRPAEPREGLLNLLAQNQTRTTTPDISTSLRVGAPSGSPERIRGAQQAAIEAEKAAFGGPLRFFPGAVRQQLGIMGQEISRNIASAGVTIGRKLGGSEQISAQDFPRVFQPIAQKIFRDDPIKSIEQRVAEAEIDIKRWGEQQGGTTGKIAKEQASVLAFAGIMGMVGLDLTPYGGLTRGAAKQAVKQTTRAGALAFLKSLKVAEEVAEKFADDIVKVTDLKKAEKLLVDIAEAQKVAKIPPKIIPEAQKATPEAISGEKGIMGKISDFPTGTGYFIELNDGRFLRGFPTKKDAQVALQKLLKGEEIPYTQGRGKLPPPLIEKGIIPKELESLALEAKKYKSAEEFVGSQKPVYHGSPTPLKSFSNKKGGVFFTEEYTDATGFAGSPDNVYEGYLNFRKPLVIDAKGAKWDELNTKYGKSTQEVVSNAQKDGYDGVVFKNIVDNIGDTADFGGQSTIYFAYKPKDAFLNESQLTDFYTQATKGIKEVRPRDTTSDSITKQIIKRGFKKNEAGVLAEDIADRVKLLQENKVSPKEIGIYIQERIDELGAEKITPKLGKGEKEEFLLSIKTGILTTLEKEKNQIRKQIGFERHTKELSGEVLSRIKGKYGIEEWKKANKEQLQSVLEDFKNLQKGDEMISKSQVESLKQFGINKWTTKREAAEILGDIKNWKGRTARFFDFFRTIDQKIERTAGKEADKVKNILTRPRAKAVTEMFREEIKLKTEMRDMLNRLRINNSGDRALIMRFGEKRITLEELKKTTPKWKEIQEADQWFRKQYDNLLETTNVELKRLGYSDDKLIPKRADYYTHAQEMGNIWNLARNKGGDINPVLEQISEFTRPNRKFNPFGLRRTGAGEFVEDAGRAFEAYLNPVLNNKHLTESIIRHRAVADIMAHNTLESKNINQFIFSLRDAADSLAGKTNPFDRALMNRVLGRKPIQLISQISGRFAKNRIIGNVGSALMQISGVPNSVIKNNLIRTTKGLLMQAVSPLLGKNDPLLKSEALLRRYGEKGLQHGETVFPTIFQKGEKIASIPFEVIEKNISKGVWRASFDNAWAQGFRGKELMDKADEIFLSIVGARSIGEKALAFESGVLSLPFQFQLEVNTSAQLWATEVFGKVFSNPVKALQAGIEASITLYLMNTLFDKTMGRTPLPDPIRTIEDVAELDSWPEKIGRIAGEGLGNVAGGQFIAGLLPQEFRKKYFGRSEVGIYPGGIPVITALSGAFRSPEKVIYDFILPYGGGQLKKIMEGIEGIDKMGSFSKSGKLQFPINPNQWLQVITFGKYSTKEAKKYFDKQRTPLSNKQTIEYFIRTQKGENPQEVYQDIAKDRIRKEYEREIIGEVIKKIKSNPVEGLALVQLWRKENILTPEMEKEIINGLTE